MDVIDTGAGIEPSARERIFDRFYRGADSGTQGAGLGLSIAKGAVEANGGRLTLACRVPTAARFRFTLPRAARPLGRARAAVINGRTPNLQRPTASGVKQMDPGRSRRRDRIFLAVML